MGSRAYFAVTIKGNFNTNVSFLVRTVLLFLDIHQTEKNRSQLFKGTA